LDSNSRLMDTNLSENSKQSAFNAIWILKSRKTGYLVPRVPR
jgi:hypothetical protein